MWNEAVSQHDNSSESSLHSDMNIIDNQCNKRPSPASDVWSVGCVLAEMFLGRKLITDDEMRLQSIKVSEVIG